MNSMPSGRKHNETQERYETQLDTIAGLMEYSTAESDIVSL
jgi:hypothetical protein